MYVLRGDGQGGFARGDVVKLPGAVTALASGEQPVRAVVAGRFAGGAGLAALGATLTTIANNTIAFNHSEGVRVIDVNNTVSKNAIFSNAGLGIDLDGDAGEVAQAGVPVFADLDGDGRVDAGEPTATSGADGSYGLVFANDGTFQIREVVPFGFAATTSNPASAAVSGGFTISGLDFGNRELPRVVCLVDSVTGDTFSIGVLQGDPQFAKWTYRIAKTGRTITGTATGMVFIMPNTLQAVQIDADGLLMTANLDTEKAKGTAQVTDRANGSKKLVVKDTVLGGGCWRLVIHESHESSQSSWDSWDSWILPPFTVLVSSA